MKLNIAQTSQLLGIPRHHLQRHWQALGLTVAHYTPGGHRRFDLAEVRAVAERRQLEKLREVEAWGEQLR